MLSKNILILGVGGKVSFGILKTLKNSDLDGFYIGACVTDYAAGFAICDKALKSPYANDANFNDWLERVISQYNIDVVLSGVEEVNNVLTDFKSKNCLILVPNKDYLDTFSNKLTTVQWLINNKINCPKTIDLNSSIKFSEIEKSLGSLL